MTDEEYKALTDREYSDFTKVPVAARGHAGLVYHEKSKFDWEVRVRLGKIAYDYHQLDEPEDREYLRAALVEIEKRFPDLSPTHIFRRIDEQGHKAVEKWWMVRVFDSRWGGALLTALSTLRTSQSGCRRRQGR